MLVISQHRGQPAGRTLDFLFNVEDTLLNLVNVWKGRRSNSADVSRAVLLTLGCYRWADLSEAIGQTGKISSVEDILKGKSCTWPQDGGVSLMVKYGSCAEILPLAPPLLQRTPDDFVDLTPFIHLGENLITVYQGHDMQAYVFFILAHQPSKVQLEDTISKRKVKEEWDIRMRNEMAKSWDVPTGPWEVDVL